MSAELVDGGLEALDDALAASWRALAEARGNPFLTPEWYLAWLATYPRERPFVVLWRRDGELRGVLPLVETRRGPLRTLRLAGARRADWFTPACSEADEAAMAHECAELLWRLRDRWHLLRLDRVDAASAWPQALWAADAPGRIPAVKHRRTDTLPFIDFGDAGYEEYLATRSRNFRSQIGRRRRKLEREHGLCFRASDDRDRLEADFSTFLELHDARWVERGGSSSSGAEVREFHRRFATAAFERGWLRLWIAEADGAPAAAWYGWRIGARYCYALSGFDRDYERLSIGAVMLAHTIERAAAEGAKVYDMMWGEEPYKQRFETGRRQAATWVLGSRRHPAQVGAALRTGLERRARDARAR